MLVTQLEQGRAEVENQYVRAVAREGNPAALKVVNEVFEVADRAWRGIGVIPASGLRLREPFAAHDAERLFPWEGGIPASESEICIAGEVLRGRAKPSQCPAFGTLCTPDTPLGAPMVSTEGACAAYFLAGRTREDASA
jgi:hydrogenase expression/formation protein HypD